MSNTMRDPERTEINDFRTMQSPKDYAKTEALQRIVEAEDAASKGQHQFLSGLLHNMAKALSIDSIPQSPTSQSNEEQGAKLRTANYLSQTLTYIAKIGDELASMDPAPAEAHNYFALLDIPPNELLIRLINQRGFVPGVFKVAELLGRDPVQDFLASAILLAKSAVYSQENVTEESQLSNTRKQEIKAEKEDGRNEESQERKRKARVPGFSINGPAEAQLSLDILTQIGNVNLPRTILAAIEILFIRRKCLEHGPFPICDPSANSLGQISKDIETDSNSTTGSKSDSQKFEHSDKNHQNNNLDEERVNQGNFNVKSTLTDKDLLNFASTNSKEKFPALHSWLHLQLEKNRALADLQSGKAGFIRSLSDSQKREQIQKHRESGEWVKAIRLAQASQYSTQEMDDLYISAVNFVAPHAVPVKQGGLKGVPNAIDPEIAQSLSLQWALSISNGEKLADTCLMHCKAWDLERASQAIKAAFASTKKDSGQQKKADGLLERFMIYKSLLENQDLGQEYKIWQDFESAVHSDGENLVQTLVFHNASKFALDLLQYTVIRQETLFKVKQSYILELLACNSERPSSIVKALRYMKELNSHELVPIGVTVIEELKEVEDRELVIRSIQATLPKEISEPEEVLLQDCAQSIEMLKQLPVTDRKRFGHLVKSPKAIFECLLVSQEFGDALKISKSFPDLVETEVLRIYASKAISFSRWMHKESSQVSSSQNSRVQTPLGSGKARFPGILNGNFADTKLRQSHIYRTAPNATLALQILQLIPNDDLRDKITLDLVQELFEETRGPTKAGNFVTMELQLEVCVTALHLLEACRSDDYNKQAQELAKKVEICQTLLSQLIPISLEDLSSKEKAEALVRRLRNSEYYALAIFVAKQYDLEQAWIWKAWTEALLKLGEFEEAEIRVGNAFKTPISRAIHLERIEPSDAELAKDVVTQIEEMEAVNLNDLEKTLGKREDRILGDSEHALNAQQFLEVLDYREEPPFNSIQDQGSEGILDEKAYFLAEKLLASYRPQDVLEFLFKYGKAAHACQLLYPPQNKGSDKESTSKEISGPIKYRYGTLWDLFRFAYSHNELRTFIRVLSSGGEQGKSALASLCQSIENNPFQEDNDEVVLGNYDDNSGLSKSFSIPKSQVYQFLLRSSQSLRIPEQAGLACLSLAWIANDFKTSIIYLQDAVLHFEDSLKAMKTNTVGLQSKRRLNPANLAHLLTKTRLQCQVYQVYQDLAKRENQTGNKDDSKALDVPRSSSEIFMIEAAHVIKNKAGVKTNQLRVASEMALENFDLGYNVIHTFGVDSLTAYKKASSRLAEKGDISGIENLAKNMKGTSSDHEIDQVLLIAAMEFQLDTKSRQQSKRRWNVGNIFQRQSPIDILVELIHSPQAKVNVLLHYNRLSDACQVALKSGYIPAVRQVLGEARKIQDSAIVQTCQTFLEGQ